MPYDLAAAVRASRRKRVEDLQLERSARQCRRSSTPIARLQLLQIILHLLAGPATVPTPQVERLHRLVLEHAHQPSPEEPKPWKKPWDK
jgi:hypothetical protein